MFVISRVRQSISQYISYDGQTDKWTVQSKIRQTDRQTGKQSVSIQTDKTGDILVKTVLFADFDVSLETVKNLGGTLWHFLYGLHKYLQCLELLPIQIDLNALLMFLSQSLSLQISLLTQGIHCPLEVRQRLCKVR